MISAANKKAMAHFFASPLLAPVGRMQSWLKNPSKLLPVSCKQMTIEDTVDGTDGISDAFLFTSAGLRGGSGVALDVSKLRPAGAPVGGTGTSSGPVSFLKIFSTLNEVYRRGGEYRNGAVVAYLDIAHPDAEEFLNANRNDIPWLKRALYVSDVEGDPSYLLTHPLYELVVSKVSDGSIWLAKKRWQNIDGYGNSPVPVDSNDVWVNRINSQVCTEVLLPSRGTCCLIPINYGQIRRTQDILTAYRQAARVVHIVHENSGVGKSDGSLKPKDDRQVGIGAIGLANFICNNGWTYADFTVALRLANDGHTASEIMAELEHLSHGKRMRLAKSVLAMKHGHLLAAEFLRKRGYVRAFAVAPTAQVSYKHTDYLGYTTAPEISPPLCHQETKRTVRTSTMMGSDTYQYPLAVETAHDVGGELYFQLACEWQRMMDATGMAHAISFNLHSDVDVAEFLPRWLKSPLISTYYRLATEQVANDKDNIAAIVGGEAQALIEQPEEGEFEFGFTFANPSDDPNYCAACAG
jgi:hypothetical protein